MKKQTGKINSLVIHFVIYLDGTMKGTESIAINTTEPETGAAIENASTSLRKKYENEHPGSVVVVSRQAHS